MPDSVLTPDIWDALRQLAFEDGERVAVMSTLAHARDRAAHDARLDAARASLAEAERRSSAATAARRAAEAAIEDTKLRIQRTETRLASGKLQNEREIAAAQHELQTLHDLLGQHEDEWLAASGDEESTAAALVQARKACEAEELDAATRRAAADGEVRDAEQRLARIDSVRRDAALKMPAGVRDRYRALYAKTGGRPFAEAAAGECSNCHRSVPASAVQLLRSRSGVPSCPSCSRLLLMP